MDENTTKPCIIGKTYIPKDNSYSVCLSKINNNHGIPDNTHDYLAGAYHPKEQAKVCIIVTEPFFVTFDRSINVLHRMIIVQYKNKQYMVLYHKDAIK